MSMQKVSQIDFTKISLIDKLINDPKFKWIILFYILYPITFTIKVINIIFCKLIDLFCHKNILIIDDLPDQNLVNPILMAYIRAKMKIDPCRIVFTSNDHREIYGDEILGNCNITYKCKSCMISFHPIVVKDKTLFYKTCFHELVHLEQIHTKKMEIGFPFGIDSSKSEHKWEGQICDAKNVDLKDAYKLPWEQHADKRAAILEQDFLIYYDEYISNPKSLMQA